MPIPKLFEMFQEAARDNALDVTFKTSDLNVGATFGITVVNDETGSMIGQCAIGDTFEVYPRAWGYIQDSLARIDESFLLSINAAMRQAVKATPPKALEAFKPYLENMLKLPKSYYTAQAVNGLIEQLEAKDDEIRQLTARVDALDAELKRQSDACICE